MDVVKTLAMLSLPVMGFQQADLQTSRLNIPNTKKSDDNELRAIAAAGGSLQQPLYLDAYDQEPCPPWDLKSH